MKQSDNLSANVLAGYRTELAVDRTCMAASRSLMAWVRTGLSLIGFGFTVYKFIESSPDTGHPETAKFIGLFVIALGILSILLGSLDYCVFSWDIRKKYGVAMRIFPLLIAALLGGLGLILFGAILLNVT